MAQRMSTRTGSTKSFLKWAGGKSRSSAALVSLAPAYTGIYREPFMGSAAVFFELEPARATLSDANEDLVICFQEVARDPESVMALLDEMPNTKEHYLRAREQDPSRLTNLRRAARLIYLNKTGFRGLWRVNRSGQFNVPYGQYDRPYYNRETLLRASDVLGRAEIRHEDFTSAIASAESGDWVYLDPPYVPDRQWGDFRRYTAGQFPDSSLDQLAEVVREASDRGVYVTMTNSDTEQVRTRFAEFKFTRLATRRDITLNASERTSVDLVITNYDVPSSTLF